MMSAVQAALGTNEVNAAMGVVCATPTAGASGTLPGVLTAIKNTLNLTRDQQIRFLFTSSLFGMVTANNAMILWCCWWMSSRSRQCFSDGRRCDC